MQECKGRGKGKVNAKFPVAIYLIHVSHVSVE